MQRLSCTIGWFVLAVLVAIPLAAAPDALDKETPGAGRTVHQEVGISHVRLSHEFAMLLAGTTLLVVAAIVRRTG